MNSRNKSDRTLLSDEQLIRLVNNATGFYEAARRAAAPVPIPGTDQFIAPIPAAIVCLAFSAELLLKALIEVRGRPTPNEHKLDSLFDLLSATDQERIKGKFHSGAESPDLALASVLKDISNAFVDWRYWHERNDDIIISYKYLKLFAESLLDEVKISEKLSSILDTIKNH